MIAAPMTDHACLGPTTDLIVAEVTDRNPAIVDLAARFTNTDELAAWFRTPQRDDDGDPADGPKVAACRPPRSHLAGWRLLDHHDAFPAPPIARTEAA